MNKNKVKVMIVDDSSVVRQTLTELFQNEPEIEVVATAQDPYIAAEKLKQVLPDVLILDVEMPRMDGISFLKKLMRQHPIPTVICSTLVAQGSDTFNEAMQAGAVDIITKPTLGTKKFLEESKIQLVDIILAAAKIGSGGLKKLVNSRDTTMRQVTAKETADVMIKPHASRTAMAETTDKVIVIGSSTGGTQAIAEVLQKMPLDCPGIVIVQHMPGGFTQSFADRLNNECRISVREAKSGDAVLTGSALIAPGGYHLMLKRSGARYSVVVKEGPLVSRHRPSVDVLFRSAAQYAGKNAVAAILTGMGDDGANGMKELFDAGAFTIAQDEATSIVYGMPREAVARGGVHKSLPLESITHALLRAAHSQH